MKPILRAHLLMLTLSGAVLGLWNTSQERLRKGKETGDYSLSWIIVTSGVVVIVIIVVALFKDVILGWFGKIPRS